MGFRASSAVCVGALALVVAAILSACGGDKAQVSSEPAATALIECDGNGTLATTPVVRTRSNGVLVRVTNSSGDPLVLNYTVDRGSGGGGDMVIPPGESEQVIPFAARSLGFRCLREDEDDTIMDFALDFETVNVVDPHDEAKQAQPLQCSSERPEAEDPTEEDAGSRSGTDPVTITEEYLRSRGLLQPADVIESAVAPGPEFPVVRFVRKGRVVGAFWFAQTSGGFALDAVQLCPSLS